MFGSLGWGEIVVLLIAALLIFGPDKLPSFARDAARALRQFREMAQGARQTLKSELGPEFKDFDLDTLNPRRFVRKHLFEDDDDWRSSLSSLDIDEDAVRRPGQQRLKDGERAPYDPDTT